ncbi:hypothetical protein [Halomonas sp.]|uniref:hypothetical protein n=1 Tax=Halomonas sp. TaxID=1486246 RepID=UPI00298DB955|nr:hypothetical protein [Halomonas sp.]MDW7746777.1 hypothetical protein [Halomonas sp.]
MITGNRPAEDSVSQCTTPSPNKAIESGWQEGTPYVQSYQPLEAQENGMAVDGDPWK